MQDAFGLLSEETASLTKAVDTAAFGSNLPALVPRIQAHHEALALYLDAIAVVKDSEDLAIRSQAFRKDRQGYLRAWLKALGNVNRLGQTAGRAQLRAGQNRSIITGLHCCRARTN